MNPVILPLVMQTFPKSYDDEEETLPTPTPFKTLQQEILEVEKDIQDANKYIESTLQRETIQVEPLQVETPSDDSLFAQGFFMGILFMGLTFTLINKILS